MTLAVINSMNIACGRSEKRFLTQLYWREKLWNTLDYIKTEKGKCLVYCFWCFGLIKNIFYKQGRYKTPTILSGYHVEEFHKCAFKFALVLYSGFCKCELNPQTRRFKNNFIKKWYEKCFYFDVFEEFLYKFSWERFFLELTVNCTL